MTSIWSGSKKKQEYVFTAQDPEIIKRRGEMDPTRKLYEQMIGRFSALQQLTTVLEERLGREGGERRGHW